MTPVTATNTVFESNGDDLYTILRRIDNHLPTNIVEGFPWVSGIFQDRSFTGSTHTTLTPIVQSGIAADLVEGDYFVCREPGIYILSCGGGTASTIPTNAISVSVWKIVDTEINIGSAHNTRLPLQAITVILYMNIGERLQQRIYSNNEDQSTINNSGTIRYFTFARIG